jgi:hypothetical protein
VLYREVERHDAADAPADDHRGLRGDRAEERGRVLAVASPRRPVKLCSAVARPASTSRRASSYSAIRDWAERAAAEVEGWDDVEPAGKTERALECIGRLAAS